MRHELALNRDGAPFAVPPEVVGWRVRRAQGGRGRPELVYRGGKPLVVPVDATCADLLAAAGPGRYRLDPIDSAGRRAVTVPVAWIGPLHPKDEPVAELEASSSTARQRRGRPMQETMLCDAVAANTQVLEKAIGQFGTTLQGTAALLRAAQDAGLPRRPLRVSVRAPLAVEHDRGDGDDELEAAPPAVPSGMPAFVRFLIEEAAEKLVPIIIEKIVSGGLGGFPIEALLSWRTAGPAAPPSIEEARPAESASIANASRAGAPSAVPATSSAPPPPMAPDACSSATPASASVDAGPSDPNSSSLA
jgi:hypothetical protein